MEQVVFTYQGVRATDGNRSMDRVKCIKTVRGLLGIGLKEAKDIIDKIQQNPNIAELVPTIINFSGAPDVEVMKHLSILESEGVMTSINSPINDIRMQLVDLIKEATDAECYGMAGDIAKVCDKYFGLSIAHIRGDKE